MSKPKIYKKENNWILTYKFKARSMWLFGSVGEERQRIIDSCIQDLKFKSFQKALDKCRQLYRSREIELG